MSVRDSVLQAIRSGAVSFTDLRVFTGREQHDIQNALGTLQDAGLILWERSGGPKGLGQWIAL